MEQRLVGVLEVVSDVVDNRPARAQKRCEFSVRDMAVATCRSVNKTHEDRVVAHGLLSMASQWDRPPFGDGILHARRKL